MLKKFSTSLLLALIVFSFGNSYSRDDKGRDINRRILDGSEVGVPYNSAKIPNSPTANLDYAPLTTAGGLIVNFHPFGLTTYYDLQSNGTVNEIWQNPLTPDNVHAACMVLPTFGGTRYCIYAYSTDRGSSWSVLGNVAEAQSGFPSIDGISQDDRAIVSMHTTAGSVPAARTQLFLDQGAGFGVFDRLDPGQNGTVNMIWGRVLYTGATSNPQKFVNVSSENGGTALAGTTTVSSTTPPGTFSAWSNYAGETAEQYSLARGEDGRIGHAFIVPAAEDEGSVKFRESNDGGLTWGAAVTVYDANATADSMGAFRGISCIYNGNTPCVTFEKDNLAVLFTAPSHIMFWSPTVNGGTPVELAGPSSITYYPAGGAAGTNAGVFTPLCRPAIGKTNVGGSSALFIAFNATTDQSNPTDSNNFFATYFMSSGNGGNTWTAPERITPTSPVRNYRYVSLSHTSSEKNATHWLVQGLVQVNSYAGAFAPNEPPGSSDFLGFTVEVPKTVGVTPIGTSIPDQFSLKQNFPNPFNPTTSIRFDLKSASNVTLKVYNAKGQEVATLVNNEFVSAGTKEVTFSGYEFASGVYYYTLSAGNFVETKKMMLIK